MGAVVELDAEVEFYTTTTSKTFVARKEQEVLGHEQALSLKAAPSQWDQKGLSELQEEGSKSDPA